MYKKIIAVILIMIFSVSLFSGCSLVKRNTSNVSSVVSVAQVSDNVKKTLDSYEKFVKKYIKFMKNFKKGDTKKIPKYNALLEKLDRFNKKLDKLAESSLTSADSEYYNKVMKRVEKRLKKAGL